MRVWGGHGIPCPFQGLRRSCSYQLPTTSLHIRWPENEGVQVGYQLATAGRSRRVLRLVLARTYQLRDLSLDLTLSQVDIFVLFSLRSRMAGV